MSQENQTAAQFIRKVSGSLDLEKTLEKAVAILAKHNIPHLVCGGYAVQEYGYPRYTHDIDIIVPDVQKARDELMYSDLFRKNKGSSMTVTDVETHVEIDFLPGGGILDKSVIAVPLPMPTEVSSKPQLITLAGLITAKLGAGRDRDLGDVTELIKANDLPQDLSLPSQVITAYQIRWTNAQREKKAALDTSEDSPTFN
jgi:hypothetical protein